MSLLEDLNVIPKKIKHYKYGIFILNEKSQSDLLHYVSPTKHHLDSHYDIKYTKARLWMQLRLKNIKVID